MIVDNLVHYSEAIRLANDNVHYLKLSDCYLNDHTCHVISKAFEYLTLKGILSDISCYQASIIQMFTWEAEKGLSSLMVWEGMNLLAQDWWLSLNKCNLNDKDNNCKSWVAEIRKARLGTCVKYNGYLDSEHLNNGNIWITFF